MNKETNGVNTMFLRPRRQFWERPRTTTDLSILLLKRQYQFQCTRLGTVFPLNAVSRHQTTPPTSTCNNPSASCATYEEAHRLAAPMVASPPLVVYRVMRVYLSTPTEIGMLAQPPVNFSPAKLLRSTAEISARPSNNR
jgi:hypothetical protein